MEYPKRIVILPFLLTLLIPTASAQLRPDYYADICPDLASLVGNAVAAKRQQTFTSIAGTLRLFFHDCFVRGCDASVLLTSPSNNAERDHPDDLSLPGDGFDTVIKAKAAVDSDIRCKNKVSCADILALAARDAVHQAGGPYYPVELGRLDGRISTKASVEGQLPHPEFNLDRLNEMFASHGLTQTDMIALSGAHTLGFSHCDRFSKRIYNFSTDLRVDPTLDPSYALILQQQCPRNADPTAAVRLDPVTEKTFDNIYYQNLQRGMGLLTSDQILYTDIRSREIVNLFAENYTAFQVAFVNAMTKLGRVGVRTGDEGEIRRDCTTVN